MLTIITMANAQVNVDFLENGRVEHYLLHAGFKFSVRTSRNNRRYWKCLFRNCLATIVTVNPNHPSDHIGLAAASFVTNVKKRCREEVNPIPSIDDEEVGSLRNRDFDDDVEDMIRRIPTFESCKASLYRSRAKVLPNYPKHRGSMDRDNSSGDICTQRRHT